MKRTLASQSLHTVLSMVGNQGLQIAAGIALSRVYGPAGKGAVTYAGIAILGVIAIADGLGSAAARQCGTDARAVPAARAAALRMVTAISLVATLPLVLLGLLEPAQHALLFVGLAFPFALYFQTMSSFFLLARRVELTNLASLVINAGAAAVMLVATLAFRPAIDVILAIWSGGYVAGALILAMGMRATRERVDPRTLRESFAVQTQFALRSSSAAFMTFIASRVDVFIVAATLSADALGNYTLALACGELMWQIGRALSWSAYGRVATMEFGAAAELTAKITRIVLAVEAAVAIVAFAAGPAVIKLVYGAAFMGAGPVLRILVLGMALYAGDAIVSYFLAVKVGRPGTILRIEFATLVVCTIGSLATLPRLGIVGPALATTLAYCVSFGVKALLFSRTTGVGIATLMLVRPGDLSRSAPAAESVAVSS
jgi:O-antigen/teichoic acid export membrane protein